MGTLSELFSILDKNVKNLVIIDLQRKEISPWHK